MDMIITCDYSETYAFQWVPDPGKTIEEDPPVEQSWYVTINHVVDWEGTSGMGYDPATLAGHTRVTGPDQSYVERSYTMSWDPNPPPGTLEEDGDGRGDIGEFYDFAIPAAEFAEVTLKWEAALSVSGPVAGYLELLRGNPRRNPKAEAWIPQWPGVVRPGGLMEGTVSWRFHVGARHPNHPYRVTVVLENPTNGYLAGKTPIDTGDASRDNVPFFLSVKPDVPPGDYLLIPYLYWWDGKSWKLLGTGLGRAVGIQ